MSKATNKILPELIDTARKLPEEAQQTLIRLGQDILFINKVQNEKSANS